MFIGEKIQREDSAAFEASTDSNYTCNHSVRGVGLQSACAIWADVSRIQRVVVELCKHVTVLTLEKHSVRDLVAAYLRDCKQFVTKASA
jgi:hypothetical protein